MVYKNGPRFKVRPVADIEEDLAEARNRYGPDIRRIFLPAGNTIAMKTDHLCRVCGYARDLFPNLERITVYGSSQFIFQKGPAEMKRLATAGLTRIHVGLESGDDETLTRLKKGTTKKQQIEAGRYVTEAGIELSEYVMLGIAGTERSREHVGETADALNAINPHFIRLRTFVPKINTQLLEEIQQGAFEMLGPHGVLTETARIIENLTVTSNLASDHYTNYINLDGRLPKDRARFLEVLAAALKRDESEFRPFFIGTQ
jgi:radical SAM superfamily enzyme YgiQ (UPF0313 family)